MHAIDVDAVPEETEGEPLDGFVRTEIDDEGNVTAWCRFDETQPVVATTARTIEDACFQLGLLVALRYPERILFEAAEDVEEDVETEEPDPFDW